MSQTIHVSVVSVRLSPEVEAYLKQHKLKPGPFAKQAVEREVKRRMFREAMDHFRKHPIKLDKAAQDVIRWDRDHGH